MILNLCTVGGCLFVVERVLGLVSFHGLFRLLMGLHFLFLFF